MKKLRTILIVLGVVISLLFVTNQVESREPEATLNDLLSPYPSGIYKYAFTYDTYEDWDSLNCVKRGGFLYDKTIPYSRFSDTSNVLHCITTYVEINGNNAKFYAGERAQNTSGRNINLRVKL